MGKQKRKHSNSTTVSDLVEKYISLKTTVRTSTKNNFEYLFKKIQKHLFCHQKIKEIHNSDVKYWMVSLQESGYSYSEIRSIHSILKLSFQMAVDDELISKNPFSFKLTSVVKNATQHREV